MSVASFALAVVFIIRLFSTSACRVPKLMLSDAEKRNNLMLTPLTPVATLVVVIRAI